MYVCVYMSTAECICMHEYSIHAQMCRYIDAQKYVSMHVHMSVCTYVCMYVCTYVCVYMSMAECICMHECRQFEPKQLNDLPTNEIGIVANPMLTSKSIAQLQGTTMSDLIIEQEEVCEDSLTGVARIVSAFTPPHTHTHTHTHTYKHTYTSH